MKARIVVVGLGNPILCDDSVGIKVADLVGKCLPADGLIDVKEAHAGGLRLMESLQGYERAVIVDAMQSGGYPPGTVTTFMLGHARGTRNLRCTHDGDLETVLVLGRELGLDLPREIHVVAIEAQNTDCFSEELTRGVQQALPEAVAATLRCCSMAGGESHEVII